MNNGRIYDIVLTVLKKEGRGNIVKPDRFTYLLQQCHQEYYNQQYEKWAGSQRMHDSLRPFLVLDEVVSHTAGVIDIAADLDYTYRHLVAVRGSTADEKIDVVTPLEWNEWMGDAVMKGTASYPLLTIDGTEMLLYPSNNPGLTGVKISYLREAENEPFFDYYLDASYNVKYLTVDQVYTLQAGETYRDGTTSGAKTSLSEELEWGDMDKVNIISMLLEKLGVSMQAPDVAQYAMTKQQQQNVV
jgi:hypothetical protein